MNVRAGEHDAQAITGAGNCFNIRVVEFERSVHWGRLTNSDHPPKRKR
jgi:hypothetical protein